MNIEKFYIPSSLDDPDVLFYCTMIEWSMFAVCLMFGLFLKSFGLGAIAGSAVIFVSKKVKSRVGSEQILLLFYWHFPVWISSFIHLPLSYKRKYII